MRRIILFSIVVLIIVAITLSVYAGFFTNIKITEKQIGPYIMVIQDFNGSQNEELKRIKSMDSLLLIEGIKTDKSFKITRNWDNENVKINSQIGLILSQKDTERVKELQKKGFIIFEMGLTNAINTEIDSNNKLSKKIGDFKVYPAFKKHCKLNNYIVEAIIEIYSKEKIIYAMEIKR